MMAYEQRCNEDNSTLGEIFFFLSDELADITFGESFQIILNVMLDSIYAVFRPTEEQMNVFIEIFVGRLPEYLRNSLVKCVTAA